MAERFPVTIVNHVTVDIAVPPQAVWAELASSMVDGAGFRAAGYAIEPLDGPSAPLGGYRMRIEHEGAVDERIVHITENDDAAHRVSLTADYLSVEGGLRVYVTYHAQHATTGARLAIDCHTQTTVEAADASAKAVADATARLAADYDAALVAGFGRVRDRLEAAA